MPLSHGTTRGETFSEPLAITVGRLDKAHPGSILSLYGIYYI